MAIYGITYVDGRCKGQHALFDTTVHTDGTIRCRGQTYYVTLNADMTGTASIHAPAPQVGLQTGGAMSAWNQLRHEINRTLPAELHRANFYLRQTLHELKRIKVGVG